MLVGSAIGQLLCLTARLLFHPHLRPDIAIALVAGVPSAIGLTVILFSGRRWVTMLGAAILAVAPGWFGMLVALQVASSG